MVTNLSGIQGMDVFDTNGEKVGTVADVLAVQALSQNSTPDSSVDTVPTTGEVAYTGGSFDSGTAGEGTILKVESGGIMGIGATVLYIPVKDVQSVAPGENLTINCRKDACDNLYANKLDFLSAMHRADDDSPPGA
jgi:PRC-barrel domain